MNQLQFNVWDIDHKKMFRNAFGLTKEGSKTWARFNLESSDNLIWLQFIGLEDKKGRYIHNGDILKSSTKVPDYFEVYYSDGGFKYRNKSKYIDLSFSGHNSLDKILSILEVVGNVYENPELLK